MASWKENNEACRWTRGGVKNECVWTKGGIGDVQAAASVRERDSAHRERQNQSRVCRQSEHQTLATENATHLNVMPVRIVLAFPYRTSPVQRVRHVPARLDALLHVFGPARFELLRDFSKCGVL